MSDPQQSFGGRAWRAAVIGGLCGLAWAAALRAYMAEIVHVSIVEWFGTLVGVLLPGVVTGALLGLAWARGTAGRTTRIGWFALAPVSFAIAPLLEPGAIMALFTEGLGGGAVAFAIAAIVGGFALSCAGPLWARIVCGVVAVAFIGGLVVASGLIRGPRLELTEPRGVWVGLLIASLAALLMLATSIPFRFMRDQGESG